MPDSSNALLESLAHPAQINLLQDYRGASEAANNIWANREWQAKQAAGQAFQNSLNPDGTPNQQQLNINLKDPAAALAAQDSAQKGQTLDNDTFNTHMKRLTAMNAAAMALQAQYPNGVPQQAVNDEIDRLGPTFGLSPQEIAQAKQSFGADPVANSRTIIRNGVSNLQAQEALHATRPGATTVSNGQGVYGGNVAPAASDNPGALNVPGAPQTAGGGVQMETSPDTNANESNVYKKMPDGTYQQVPEARSARPGASGIVAPAPAGPIPTNGAYRPRGTVVGGGAQPAPPAQTDATPPSAASPPDGQPQPTAPAAPGGPSLSAPPQGQPGLLEAGNKLYADAAAAKSDQQKRLIAGESALDALKMASTGPGSGTVAQMKAFLEAHGFTAPPQGTMSAVDYRQILAKNLLRFAQSSGQAAGTNLGLETKIHENANVEEMLPLANVHVLKQDLGILRRDMTRTDTMPKGEAAVEHAKTFDNTMDPRAFAWDRLEPGERSAIMAQADAQDRVVDPSGKKTPNMDKLRASLTAALKSGYVKPDAAPPSAAPAASAPPPVTRPPVNFLAGPGLGSGAPTD